MTDLQGRIFYTPSMLNKNVAVRLTKKKSKIILQRHTKGVKVIPAIHHTENEGNYLDV